MSVKRRGRLWGNIRAAVELTGFALLLCLFASGSLPWLPEAPAFVRDLQAGPGLLRGIWTNYEVLFFGAAAAVLLLTLLFGRVFCACMCPLGMLQDFFIFLSRLLFRRRKRSLLPSWRRLRMLVLMGAALCVISGFMAPLYLLEPFSVFGRMTAALFLPLATLVNNIAVELVGAGKYAWLHPLKYPSQTLAAQLLAGFSLAALGGAALFYGRVYCNTLCPVGALLSFISRYSLFKIRIAEGSCPGCRQCGKNCRAACIDVDKRAVDNERCVMCLDCLDVCTAAAIGFSPRLDGIRKALPVETDISRRNFLLGTGAVAAMALLPPLLPVKKRTGLPVMPPGAMAMKDFNSRCLACHVCVNACPTRVIRPGLLDYGLAGIMQPVLDFSRGMCEYDCTACSHACPAGALKPLTINQKHELQIGRVHYHRERCVVYTNHTFCGACAEHCPTGAVVMVDWEQGLTIPKTNVSTCVGCGSCEKICPVKPLKAITVDGVERQEPAMRPVYEPVKAGTAGNEFPF